MAVVQTYISPYEDSCPNSVINDATRYYEDDVFPSFVFSFHDYSGGLPTINSSFLFDNLSIGGDVITGVSITIETDGAGNIINPEPQYLAITNQINSFNEEIHAVFIQPPNSGYRDWSIYIYSSNASDSSAITSIDSPGGISPVISDMSSIVPVLARNLTVIHEDGSVLDLGSVSQEDDIVFSSLTYTEGEVITISFCGDSVAYTVGEDTGRVCVIKGVLEAIDARMGTGDLFCRYVVVSIVGDSIHIVSKEAGIPLQFSVSYTGAEEVSLVNRVPNSPSMNLPQTLENDIQLSLLMSGRFTATLTVVSECDYNVYTRDFYDWCYLFEKIECCLYDKISDKLCCKGKVDYSLLLAVVESARFLINESETDNEKVGNILAIGEEICGCDCGCN